MEIERRTLLLGAGAALASGLAPRAAAALAASDALILAPARRPDGSFAVLVFSERYELVRAIPLPARGHDIAVHRESGRAVAFARRPGTFAVAFDIGARAAPRVFLAPPDRHFFGHGAYSADGALLYATENDFGAQRSVVGVYDATDRYRRVGEFPSHGIGAHEALMMAGGRMLAVANGGIATHPDHGRQKLNLASMDPSLAFLDLDGHLIARHRLPQERRRLSIRHMAVGADGAVWFGAQWEGDPLATPPLVGHASPEAGLTLAAVPGPALNAMRGYVGAVAASRDGSIICASAPRGGVLAYWSARTGGYLGGTSIADASGVAGFRAGGFLAASGDGLMVEAGAEGVAPVLRRPGTAFDNHLRRVGA